MVNEFMPLSPRKDDDEDCFCRESLEKTQSSESSDEDTTSSSLIPIPDTLDVMRNELKSTINNFGAMDYDGSPKVNELSLKNLDLDLKHPTEREVSIVRKIKSANLLLDDLLNAGNMLPKNVADKNPLVFNSDVIRHRSSPPSSGSSDPSTGSTSTSENLCPSVPVVSFSYPVAVCECSRYTKEKPEPAPGPVDNGPEELLDPKKVERKSSLLDRVKNMRLRYQRRGKTLVNESQQTLPSYPLPNTVHGYANGGHFQLCPEGASYCSMDQVGGKKTTVKDAKSGNDDPLDNVKLPEDHRRNEGMPPDENVSRTKIPQIPIQVTPTTKKERIDIYYFDHGNSSYYRTTDSHRARFTEQILEKTDEYASKFWAEVFGTVTVVIAFIVSFILQLYRCVFTSLIRALAVGLIQIFSDYLFKPLLTVIFNGLLQPCLILGYNVATSVRDFCIPVCEVCEFCAKDLAILFGSCRLVEVKQKEPCPSCHCRHSV